MTATIESPADVGTDQAAIVTRWLKELELADKHEHNWRNAGNKVVNRYRDERDRTLSSNKERFNILYANTEVLKGIMYAHPPTTDIRRRHKGEDPIGREAAMMLNDVLTYCIDAHDLDGTLSAVVEDVLLPGRGQAWVRYKATTGADGNVAYEEVIPEYIEWETFRYSPAKRWSKVRWVARYELLTRDELKSQFGGIGAKCALDWMPKGMEDNADNQIFKRAQVWMIWSKSDRKVYAICGGNREQPLAVVDDPLKLQDFFPCPEPVYGVHTTNSLVPIPEFTLYQDQAQELDQITDRINKLTDALKRRGVYDSMFPELEKLANAGDNEFIPIENFTNFSDKGGLEKALVESPIETISKVLVGLYQQRDQVKTTIYEITGIADIARGASNPNETLGAQQLKSQYSNVRIQPRQKSIQKFARNLLRLMAEIVCEHFSPQTIGIMIGRPVDPQVLEVIKNDKLRGFYVDIETDSTIEPDADAEQKNRIELLTAITTFLQQAVPGVQMGAVPMEVAKELLMFGVRAFKTGPQLEQVLENWTNQSGGDPMAQQQAQMQAQQQAEQMQMQQQQMQQQAQQLAQQEQAVKDQAVQVEKERMQLDYEKKLFDMQKKVEDFMAKQRDDSLAMQDQFKAETEKGAKAKVEEKETMLTQLVESQQAMMEMLGQMLQSQDAMMQGMQQIAQIAAADRESELIRDGKGKAQKAVSRIVLPKPETLQ